MDTPRLSGFALRAKSVMGQWGKKISFTFLCISEYFESIETHFFWKFFLSTKTEGATPPHRASVKMHEGPCNTSTHINCGNISNTKLIQRVKIFCCTYFSISGAQWTKSWFQNLNVGFLISSTNVMSSPHGWGLLTITRSTSTLKSDRSIHCVTWWKNQTKISLKFQLITYS